MASTCHLHHVFQNAKTALLPIIQRAATLVSFHDFYTIASPRKTRKSECPHARSGWQSKKAPDAAENIRLPDLTRHDLLMPRGIQVGATEVPLRDVV